MGFFRTIVLSALLSGVVAGAIQTGLQNLVVYPLIFTAETYEGLAKHNDSHHHSDRSKTASDMNHHENQTWGHFDGASRLSFSFFTNILLGVALALILAAIFALRPSTDWRHGILWGLGGFAAVNLAPAFGLPPALPGMAEGDLQSRQIWWLTTAILTASGIALLFLSKTAIWRLGGPLLLVLPHIYGAPRVQSLNSKVPAILAAEFVTASLISNLVFWIFLGILTAVIMERVNGQKRTERANSPF